MVPGLALASTCRQIREEYRPMCLRADVTLDWRDIPTYFALFFPFQNGATVNIEFAPERMTIFNNTCFTKGLFRSLVIIDLLPLVNFSLAKENFSCTFTTRESKRKPSMMDRLYTPAQLQDMQRADSLTLQQIVTHRNSEWAQDISAGRIHKIIVSQVGTGLFPRATFHTGPGRDKRMMPELGDPDMMRREGTDNPAAMGVAARSWAYYSERNCLENYLERVGLKRIFIENQYTFFRGHVRAWGLYSAK